MNNFRYLIILWICQSREFPLEYGIKVKKLKHRIDSYQRANIRIDKIVSSTEYRMEEQFRNCQFLETNFDFSYWKKIWNFLIFRFGQFQKLQIWKSWKIFNLENFKNLQCSGFKKILIRKIPRNFNSENSKKFQFREFLQFWIWKIRNWTISEILLFYEFVNLENFH